MGTGARCSQASGAVPQADCSIKGAGSDARKLSSPIAALHASAGSAGARAAAIEYNRQDYIDSASNLVGLRRMLLFSGQLGGPVRFFDQLRTLQSFFATSAGTFQRIALQRGHRGPSMGETSAVLHKMQFKNSYVLLCHCIRAVYLFFHGAPIAGWPA